MCDFIDGELIISFPNEDPVAVSLMERIKSSLIGGIGYLQDINQRINEVSRHETHMRPDLAYQVTS